MTKRMLVDATHPEETRVAIVDSYRDTNRLDDLDFGLASKPILRGNIYLAKVMRIEPSLQAAFVEYGGNRHGFLPFSEIHPDYFRIPMADRSQEEQEEELAEAEAEDIEQDHDIEAPINEVDADNDLNGDIGNEPQKDFPDEVTSSLETPVSEANEQAMPALETSSVFADIETHDSLITDFGNALVTPANISEVPMESTPPESIGGDMAERFVRRHRPRYKIQEVLKRGQIMLIQVVKEERGNKGAALTTFLSLAGRYCVLMPNTDHGGGVSRKITNHQDRRRMKEILDQLDLPEGMAVILRTAGLEQDPPEIQRDLEYLLRLWDSIREQTLQSTAPALIYEEANLIKRSVRDLFTKDIAEILVAGQEGYNRAREFMSALMPDQVEKIKLYEGAIPLFFRYHVESQIDKIHNPVVQLRSGGYIVINPTEALVAIDVNSGRATRERHIEETALKTNLEAADEIARQLRLRDLAGLIVIDFIDMEDGRNNAAVERRLKEAMKNDRARLQIGRISPFGLLELSRQRLRPSLHEINFEKCAHCAGSGFVRSVDSAAFSILRAIEEEGIRQRSSDLVFNIATPVALYIFNHKRDALHAIERRYDLHVMLKADDSLIPPDYKLDKSRGRSGGRRVGPAVNADQVLAETERDMTAPHLTAEGTPEEFYEETQSQVLLDEGSSDRIDRGSHRRRFRQAGRRDQRRGGGSFSGKQDNSQQKFQPEFDDQPGNVPESSMSDEGALESIGNAQDFQHQEGDFHGQGGANRRRRRGRRGGRGRGNGNEGRIHEHGGNRWGREQQQRSEHQGSYRQEQSLVVPVHDIPASIHEIDTTPRDPYHPAPSLIREQARQAEPQHESRHENHQPARDPAEYEVINPPTDKPKGGWWRKLTGQ